MQRNTFKLSGQLVLALAAISFALPGEASANLSYLGTVGLGWTYFGAKKAKLSGLKLAEIKEKKVTDLINSGDIETEQENFFRALDLNVGFYMLWQLNDIFSLGAGLNLGISFSKEQLKSWKSVTISEGFVGKVGLAAKITDWVLLSAGLRVSYVTLGLSFTDDDKKAFDASDDFKGSYNTSKDPSGNQWVCGLYGDINLLVPISDNIKFVATLGIFSDLSQAEFKDFTTLGKDTTTTAPAASGAPGDGRDGDGHTPVDVTAGISATTPAAKWTEGALSPKLEGRLGIRIGLGVAFEF